MADYTFLKASDGQWLKILVDSDGIIQASPNADDSDLAPIIAGDAANAVHADTADVADLATTATTATGPADATTFTAALNTATTSLKGLLPAADQVKLNSLVTFPVATMTTGDQTLTPGVTTSVYILPAGTTAAASTYTIATTSATQAQVVNFNIYAQAHDVEIANGAGAALIIVPTGLQKQVVIYFSTNQWILSTHQVIA